MDTKAIIINKANMKDVLIQGVTMPVNKSTGCGDKGTKVKLVIDLKLDGASMLEIFQAGAEHYAKNWYNNHRPDLNRDNQSEAEYDRRVSFWLGNEGKVIPIDATSVGSQKVGRQVTAKELIDLYNDEKEVEVKAYFKVRILEKQEENRKETELINAAIANIK